MHANESKGTIVYDGSTFFNDAVFSRAFFLHLLGGGVRGDFSSVDFLDFGSLWTRSRLLVAFGLSPEELLVIAAVPKPFHVFPLLIFRVISFLLRAQSAVPAAFAGCLRLYKVLAAKKCLGRERSLCGRHHHPTPSHRPLQPAALFPHPLSLFSPSSASRVIRSYGQS